MRVVAVLILLAALVPGDNPWPWQAEGVIQNTTEEAVTVWCDGCPPESIRTLPPGAAVPFQFALDAEYYVIQRHWNGCGMWVWTAATLTHNPDNLTFDADTLIHIWGDSLRSMTLPPKDYEVECE